jgi:hypothetical protein
MEPVSLDDATTPLMVAIEHPAVLSKIEAACADPGRFVERRFFASEGAPDPEPMEAWRARAVVAAVTRA